jgi:NAD+ diphosphatase
MGLSSRDGNLYAIVHTLANFHSSHLHCSHCGKPTVIEKGGWSRRCFADDKQVFPRTDPAIIVSVTDSQDRILLGSQGVWEENRWSILAGFVEAGESLTAAVAREVLEEAGVKVHQIEYLGSQAWPFPHSLMVGFSATLDESGDEQTAVPDGIEIAKVQWFTREEILSGYKSGALILAGPLTIARAMIEHWLGGPLDA